MTLKLLAYPPKTGVQGYSSVTSTDGYHWRIQGGVRDACPPWDPNSFIFMQFSAKKLQNNRLAHPLWELVPPLRKILDPPLPICLLDPSASLQGTDAGRVGLFRPRDATSGGEHNNGRTVCPLLPRR